jgi:hypothetical protein
VATPVTTPDATPVARPKVHRRRFALLYAGLVVLLAVGTAAGVHLLTRKVVKPVPWATWSPLATSPEAKVREIAAHVAEVYKSPTGQALATVRGGPLSVGSDAAVLVKPDASATGGYKFYDGDSVEYQICGNTTKGNCAFDQKKIAPNTSGALTRRMAYELALDTFHYVPEVQNVAVLLPAVIKGQKARMLVVSRGDVKPPKTLNAAIVPIRQKDGQPTAQEELQIANQTDPLIYHYEVTATSDNEPVYLITPLLIKDTAAAPKSLS